MELKVTYEASVPIPNCGQAGDARATCEGHSFHFCVSRENL